MRVQREVTLLITKPSYNKYLPTTPHISFVIFALSVIKLMFEYIISQIQKKLALKSMSIFPIKSNADRLTWAGVK